MMLAYQVLLLLSEISQVSGWASCPNLTTSNSDSLANDSPSCYNSEALNNCPFSYLCSHAHICEALKSTIVKHSISTNEDIVSNGDFVFGISIPWGNMSKVLYYGVTSDLNLCSVTSSNDTMP